MASSPTSRRLALQSTFVTGLGLATLGSKTAQAAAAQERFMPKGASTLAELGKKLAAAPRRRDFKTTQMILQNRDEWDSEALDLVLAYAGRPKQVWNNTQLEGPWLNLMRNAMNAQVWSFKHPDFLAVSATHGAAHIALFDDAIWEKYQLGAMTKGKDKTNTWLKTPLAAVADPGAIEDPKGVYSPADNSITVLQQRGAVFLACHNAIWEFTGHLQATGNNPDKVSHEQMAAEFTNHLAPGVVLTPGIVATLVELEDAGYRYA
ncbi:transcriptional initiation protein Tat [Thiomonas intermedia]|uniref:thiosulfate dehydrogenase n=1 Tax=Thiomonas intermedia TaxID=926 RepID=UPI0009A4730E|nr:transcriptional initiation protein Tat [Thiomonas intermedia]